MATDRTFRTFWVVWCPTSGPPTYRHNDPDSARREAERLALRNPNHEFYVLESLGMAIRTDVAWVEPRTDNAEIPF